VSARTIARDRLSNGAFGYASLRDRDYVIIARTLPTTRVQVMCDQPLFPDDRQRVQRGIDRKVPFAALKPRGDIIGAHHRRQSQRQPVHGGFERLA